MDSLNPHKIKPVPVTIITGFLGAGKTTAILEILKSTGPDSRTAVMINEWGEVALDGSIVSGEHPELELREISGGCICCTAGAAFDQAVIEIIDQVAPDRIIIEPSGVAKPGEIIDLLRPHVQNGHLIIRPVICLVDLVRFIGMQWVNMPIYRDQVESAAILVANRCDLADANTLKTFHEKASKLYPPKLMIHATSFGRLPISVLDARLPAMPAYTPTLNAATQHHHAAHDKQGLTQTGWTWPAETVFSESKLKHFFQTAAKRSDPFLHRAKAVFHTDRGWFLLEIAAGTFHQRPVQYRALNGCQFIADRLSDQDVATLETAIASCIQTVEAPTSDPQDATNNNRQTVSPETNLKVELGG